MVKEIQMMNEWMDFMMNALRRQVSSDLNDLVHRTDSPFTTSVNLFSLPPKFYMSQVESYDRSNDPLNHLESLKTLMHLQGLANEINALRGRVSNDLNDFVHRTDSPFTTSVNSFPLPPKFLMLQVESYDRSNDPLDHLESFKTLMHLQGLANEIMCRAFPTTLKGPTRIWFSRLMSNSIGTFKELSAQFASHFIGGQRYKKSTACLMRIKQREDETLRSYITRFNKEALLIDEADDKILVAAFTNGLQKGKFLFSLYKNAQRLCQICFTGQLNT